MPAPAADKPAPASRPQLKLDDVIAFLGRYLYCTEHQRTLIALWVLHAHCFSAAEVTPYLSIQSALEQSGKTLSLQLLSLLCPHPALTANFATSSLSSRIHYSEQRPTFLLDECHATLGSRNRSKNPVLRAVLTSGFHRGLGHTDRKGKHVLDLLFELREAFSHYGQPERISTASLLAWLHHHPDASWNQEGPISANRLADLLRPFDIYPRLKHKKGQPSHRGYTLQDFLYTWNMLLPPEPTMNRNTSRREPMPDPPPSSRTNAATVRAALDTAASVEDRVAQSPGPPMRAGVARGGVEVPSAAETSSQKPGANSQKPSIHAAGNNRTTTL